MKALKVITILVLAVLLTACMNVPTDERPTVTVTFYPVWIAAANVLDGIDGVRLVCLTGPTTGCLHDYQLSPTELMRLTDAGIVIANGGGMENFLDKVLERDDVSVAFAVDGIELIDEGDEVNSHAWLDVKNFMRYTDNVLAAVVPFLDEADAARACANAEAYKERLSSLDAEVAAAMEKLANKEIVTFHEAFDYFAGAYGLTVLATVESEPGTVPPVQELCGLVETVRSMPRRVIFTEPQYEAEAALTAARETGAAIFALDPVVTGEFDKEAYERAMRNNVAVLTEALG